ncbi:SDR family oxidoreductase [Polymorphobacter sp.]|uniref:SDR family oxidoreductase n=1 Tax=Polymorphobacter sp. TaxID=1909290 RepID=UPI003F71503B
MALVSVIGANGVQGRAQMRQAQAAGHRLRGISRSRSAAQAAEFPDAEFRSADLLDQATLAPAIEGSDYLLVNLSVPLRAQGPVLLAAIGRAALSVGIKRLVYNTATWIPERLGDPFSYRNNTVMINALLRTGVPATVFGSVLFMDNLQTSWAKRYIVDEDRFHYPHYPTMRANWISLDDVGKVMVHALDRPDFEGAWMNIGGPERLSPQQVCAILSDVTAREIRYDPATPEQFGQLLADGLAAAVEPAEKQAFADYIRDFYIYNNEAPTRPFEVDFDHVQRRLPIRFETMREWAERQDWSRGSPGS